MEQVKDVENSFTPLLDQTQDSTETQTENFRPSRVFLLVSGIVVTCLVLGLIVDHKSYVPPEVEVENVRPSDVVSRGVSQGVSEKSFRVSRDHFENYDWSNAMLSWQRTVFHFQPEKNWMNDPNGPLFYNGWYHIFYQYNPNGAIWGDIAWGHAASRDLIHWFHLDPALIADQWYDINGVWTGSATILPDGSVIMLYTGSTADSVQVQNLALPLDRSDPLLRRWVKYSGNPVLYPPPGIGIKDFRDPTTAWLAPNGNWRITIGARYKTTGISIVYETKDFVNYTLLDGLLHQVPGTGMWECVDLYPVSLTEMKGLDTSVNGPGVKHVLKSSIDDEQNDYYALGTYNIEKNVWIPDDPAVDVGIGLRYDYGMFYASKTFYDQKRQRRILWGWTRETDSVITDIQKGWASVMTVPRTVLFDKKTKTNVLQWPVEEIESLRLTNNEFNKIKLKPGSVVPLDVGRATQLDITAEFEIDKDSLKHITESDIGYNCTASNGAGERSALGPFGLLVLTDDDRSEQTAVYFYVAKGINGNLKTYFCTDKSRSSNATDVDKTIYGSTVPVLKGEKFSVRILVDHSMVEAFAQGGRTCIASRVYPTKAIGKAAKLFLFNNATGANVTATSIEVWQLNSAFIHPYPD